MGRKKRRLVQKAPWVGAGAAGMLFVSSLAASAYFNYAFLRPRKKPSLTSDLSNYVPESTYTTDRISFESTDGLELSALLLKPERANGAAIIVCHGLAHDKYSGIRFVQYLLSDGFTLLLIDFRNHGESKGWFTTYGYYEKYDLLAGIRYLRDVAAIRGRIGVLGASMGAAVAVLAAAETDDISAVVADSPFASLKVMTTEWVRKVTRMPNPVFLIPLHLSYFWLYLLFRCSVADVEPAGKVRNVRCPLFLIHGGADQRIPASHSRQIHQNASVPAELWIEEDVEHLGVYLKNPGEYQNRVSSFFRTNLLK